MDNFAECLECAILEVLSESLNAYRHGEPATHRANILRVQLEKPRSQTVGACWEASGPIAEEDW
jgi:hypothetical protein